MSVIAIEYMLNVLVSCNDCCVHSPWVVRVLCTRPQRDIAPRPDRRDLSRRSLCSYLVSFISAGKVDNNKLYVP